MQGGLVRDLKFALRSFAKAPVFAATIVLTLAVGIGFNTAIFSIADRMLVRPLPYPNDDKIVMLHESGRTSPQMDVSPANWLDWQRDSRSFERLAAWTNRFPVTLTGDAEPEQVDADNVSHEFFELLGVAPALGRVFTVEDDRPGAPSRVVLSHSLWQRRFGSDPDIVGTTIELNESATEVIGVMPAGFQFMSTSTELWRPFALDPSVAWREVTGRFIPFVVARLKPEVTVEAAQAEMAAIGARLAQLHVFNADTSVRVIPLREVITGQVRTSLLFLFAAVGVLLLIACSNVANLLLARAARRKRELAIRTSLGAGRGSIVRQLLIESVMLALAGASAGMLIARWSIDALLALTPPELLPVSGVPIDRWVLAYAFGLALVTGVLVGLAPALGATRIQPADALRDGTRSVTSSARVRQTLIVAQVAMTVVLLCGAGLLMRSLMAATSNPTGVEASGVLTLHVELPTTRYDPAQQVLFFRQAIENLRGLPGVQSASAARDIPMSMARVAGTSFQVQGDTDLPPNERRVTRVRVVAPDYFRTLGIPMMSGREFTYQDPVAGAPPVFVVNDTFAKRYLADRDPLSTALSVSMQRPENPYGAVIGVAGDVKDGSLRGVAEPTVFYSNGQLPRAGMTLLMRTTRGLGLAPDAIRAIRGMDPNLPVTQVRMLEDAFSATVARDRLNAVVSAAFGLSALLLASLGLYGLLGHSVTERTGEIGVRMALGARAGQVLNMVVLQGLRLVAIGAVLGLAGALAMSRFLESLVYGITAQDPLTFAGVAGLLLLVSMLAVLIPARRATQIDPLIALRNE